MFRKIFFAVLLFLLFILAPAVTAQIDNVKLADNFTPEKNRLAANIQRQKSALACGCARSGRPPDCRNHVAHSAAALFRLRRLHLTLK